MPLCCGPKVHRRCVLSADPHSSPPLRGCLPFPEPVSFCSPPQLAPWHTSLTDSVPPCSPGDTLSLLRPFLPLGWRFGTIHGRVGRFPSDLVQPAAAPDFLQLPAEPGRGRAAAVAAAVASTAAAQEVGRRREVRTRGWSEEQTQQWGWHDCGGGGERGQPRAGHPGTRQPGRASQTYDLRDVSHQM